MCLWALPTFHLHLVAAINILSLTTVGLPWFLRLWGPPAPSCCGPTPCFTASDGLQVQLPCEYGDGTEGFFQILGRPAEAHCVLLSQA